MLQPIVSIFVYVACSSTAALSAAASSDVQCGIDSTSLQKTTADNAYMWSADKTDADNGMWKMASLAEDASVLLQRAAPSLNQGSEATLQNALPERIGNVEEQVAASSAPQVTINLVSDAGESQLVTADRILQNEADAMEAIISGQTTKDTVEVVLARYDENIDWSEPYKHIRTLYCKKPSDQVEGCTALPNVGREGHTFLWHIVTNYDRLSEWTVFSQAQEPTIGYQGHRKGGGHMLPGTTFDSFVLPQSAGGLPSRDGALFVVTSSLYMDNLNHSLRQTFKHARDKPNTHFSGSCPEIHLGDGWEPWWDLGNFKYWIGGRCKVPGEKVPQYFLSYWDKYIKLPRPKNNVIFFAQGARFAASRERIRQRPKQDYQDLLDLVSFSEDPCWNYFNEWIWYYIVGTPREAPCDSDLVIQQASLNSNPQVKS